MNHERIMRTLTSLGLSQIEASVYIYLASEGPQRTEQIGDALNVQEQLIRQSLESLQDKGVVFSALEKLPSFSALPFDKALELLVKAHLKEAQIIEQDKDDILSRWRKMLKNSTS